MKKLLTILSFMLLNFSAIALNSGEFSIEHKTNREEINYFLPLTADFQNLFLNAIKTGETVKVLHTVKIRPVNQWFGWLAEKNYAKYYKYDLINNQYYIGVKPTKLKPVESMQAILNDVTMLKNAPFLPKNILKKGNAYEIDFNISINPIDESSSITEKFLLFKGDGLKERLHSAVHYIDN